jgi:hypothetical protein
MVELTLDQMFQKARSTCSDINEHCDKLRELASQAGSVVELGMRHGVSTVALLAGQPQKMISYDLNHDSVADPLKSRQGRLRFGLCRAIRCPLTSNRAICCLSTRDTPLTS